MHLSVHFCVILRRFSTTQENNAKPQPQFSLSAVSPFGKEKHNLVTPHCKAFYGSFYTFFVFFTTTVAKSVLTKAKFAIIILGGGKQRLCLFTTLQLQIKEKNNMPIPTPHIAAKEGDFAKTVLMPGDPLRAKFIAENFLTDAKLVNNVRGVQGYTGYYNGKRVSVMASGMGMPSIGIYSYELFNFYGVENIIRIGSAGAIHPDLKVRNLVFAQGACTNSNYAHQFEMPGTIAPIASYSLLKKAVEVADREGYTYKVGNVLSSDTFYDDGKGSVVWGKMGVLAVEMEAAALYLNAARAGKNALCICTISDHLLTGEELSSDERQNSFTEMMKLALEIA